MTNTDLMNVNSFTNQLPAGGFAGLNPESDSLADGIGQSYGVIGYKGKVWTLRLRGETYTFRRPDDGTQAAFLDVIILRSAAYRSKSWYADGWQDGGSTGKRPTCASLDGVTPDVDVIDKQSEACAICKKNEFKTGANGRKGKDCSDYKRLAVLILPSQSKLLLGEPLLEPVFLRIPAASLNDLATLGEAMKQKGFHYSSYITRVGFDLDKSHPQMTFRALQALTNNEAPTILKMREDAQAYRITGESEIGKSKSLGAVSRPQHTQVSAMGAATNGAGVQASGAVDTGLSSVQPAQKQAAPTINLQPQANNNGANDEIAALKAKLAALENAPIGVVGAVKTGETNAVDTGFGEVISPAGNNGVKITEEIGLGSAQSVVEVAPEGSGLGGEPSTNLDTGPAEESDTDLDSLVAGLMGR